MSAAAPTAGQASRTVNVITISRQYGAGGSELVLNTSRVPLEEAAALVAAAFEALRAARGRQARR